MLAPSHFHQGQLVEDKNGEYYTIERFEGEYLGEGHGFRWRLWVRSVSNLAHIPFPANPDDLKSVTVN